MRLRENMLGKAGLMTEEREDEVTEVTVIEDSVSVLHSGRCEDLAYSSRVL